jgi:acyl carrier protein
MTKSVATIPDIKELIVRCLNLTDVKPSEIGDDDHLFVEGLGLDSVDALELVVGLETEYGLRIEDKAIGKEDFASVTALTAYINGKLRSENRDPVDGQ